MLTVKLTANMRFQDGTPFDGTVERFNNAKRAEVRDRVKHAV
jgi:hypothetical protein